MKKKIGNISYIKKKKSVKIFQNFGEILEKV